MSLNKENGKTLFLVIHLVMVNKSGAGVVSLQGRAERKYASGAVPFISYAL